MINFCKLLFQKIFTGYIFANAENSLFCEKNICEFVKNSQKKAKISLKNFPEQSIKQGKTKLYKYQNHEGIFVREKGKYIASFFFDDNFLKFSMLI